MAIPTRIVGIVQGILAFALVSTSFMYVLLVIYLLAFTVLIFFFISPAGHSSLLKIILSSLVGRGYMYFRLIWLHIQPDVFDIIFFSCIMVTFECTHYQLSCIFNEVFLSVSNQVSAFLDIFFFLMFIGHRTKTHN